MSTYSYKQDLIRAISAGKGKFTAPRVESSHPCGSPFFVRLISSRYSLCVFTAGWKWQRLRFSSAGYLPYVPQNTHTHTIPHDILCIIILLLLTKIFKDFFFHWLFLFFLEFFFRENIADYILYMRATCVFPCNQFIHPTNNTIFFSKAKRKHFTRVLTHLNYSHNTKCRARFKLSISPGNFATISNWREKNHTHTQYIRNVRKKLKEEKNHNFSS